MRKGRKTRSKPAPIRKVKVKPKVKGFKTWTGYVIGQYGGDTGKRKGILVAQKPPSKSRYTQADALRDFMRGSYYQIPNKDIGKGKNVQYIRKRKKR